MRIHKRGAHPSEQDAIDKRPDMPNEEACGMALACWRELDSCRHVGMAGAGAVPYDAIDLWARRMLISVIHQLDVERADRINSAAGLQGA